MKGIDEVGVSFHSDRNSTIYYEYTHTKQRIWQIIRRCQLGGGDYYGGFENFREKEKSLKELGVPKDQIHSLLRKWMSEKYNIKTIALKNEGK